MKTIIRICNEEGSKGTGFFIGKDETMSKIFQSEFGRGTKFEIGDKTLEIKNITVDGFYLEYLRMELIDLPEVNTNCCIWIHCKCDDSAFLSQDYDHSDTLKEINRH